MMATNLESPENSGKRPRQTQSQKDVDGVTTSDVSNGVVCGFLHSGSLFTCKQVGQRSSQGHKCDGSYSVLQSDQAPKDGC